MSRLSEIGNGFYSIRSSFTFMCGAVDIGNQMALLRLSTGRFLVLDTCEFNETDHRRINELTQNGDLIDAVVGTHPFHTMYFLPFAKKFPNPQIKYYGAPRHLRKLPSIPWAGVINDPVNLTQWEKEGIFMRVPAGGNFVDSAEDNHFSGLFVFHAPSKTLFIDDTILFMDKPGLLLRWKFGSPGTMKFWDLKKGLNHDKEAPGQFRSFIEQVMHDWDFDNIAAAHSANLIGGAKEKLRATLAAANAELDKLAAEFAKPDSKK
jgi:hypothetical protein